MATISVQQARQYAANAGFKGSALNTIVAIAYAESRFVTDAFNPGYPADPNDPPGDVEQSAGVLQINLLAHPSITRAQADDPQTAFRDAFQISNGGTNFTAWSTYTQPGPNNYTNFLNMVGGSTAGILPPNPIPGIGPVAGSLGGLGSIPGLPDIPSWIAAILGRFGIPSMQDLGYRALFIGLGFIVFIVGLVVLFRPVAEKTVQDVAPIAETAAIAS